MTKPIRLTGRKLRDLKRYVYERDMGYCQCCGEPTGAEKHHILYRSQGGGDTAENMALLCVKCHDIIHSRDPRKVITRMIRAWGGVQVIRYFLFGRAAHGGKL